MSEYRLDMENELKQSPIEGSDFSSRIEKVIARHKRHLDISRRTKWFRMGYAALLIAALLAIAIITLPLSNPSLNEKTATNSVLPLVEGNGIQIMPEDFLLYRDNMEEASKQPNLTSIPISDEQIIDNLIMDALTVQYAIKLGIVALPAEIDKEIAFQRDSLEQASEDNPVKELMENRIKRSGLTEDAFWNSDLVRKAYENTILSGKLFTKLREDGTIISGDGAEIGVFKKNLLAANIHKLTIHWSTVGK